jgi:hypothetical protein
MPEDEYAWLARDSVLGFDEVVALVDVSPVSASTRSA